VHRQEQSQIVRALLGLSGRITARDEFSVCVPWHLACNGVFGLISAI